MSYSASSIQTKKVLILSNDQYCINELQKNNHDNKNIEIVAFSNPYRIFLFIEESSFDVIIFDYSLSDRNTLPFLEYLSTVDNQARKSIKIVLVEKLNQIEESIRNELSNVANKIISKTSVDFGAMDLVHDYSCGEEIAITC